MRTDSWKYGNRDSRSDGRDNIATNETIKQMLDMDTQSIIVLGNGFDVALGIATRYSQFYENSKELRSLDENGNKL